MSKNSAIKVTETQVFIGYVSERCTARSGQMTSRTLFDKLRVELSFRDRASDRMSLAHHEQCKSSANG